MQILLSLFLSCELFSQKSYEFWGIGYNSAPDLLPSTEAELLLLLFLSLAVLQYTSLHYECYAIDEKSWKKHG